MCGIIGYTGGKEAEGIIVDGLEILEYRGYDSAGIAVSQKDGGVQMRKCAGRVRDLRSLCRKGKIQGTCGIGHTRWATHGGVCDANAHPHRFGKVTVVHNGIIENYRGLAKKYNLQDRLRSQTDSEVAAAVLAHFYNGDPFAAIRKTVLKLKGTFAFGILFEDIPEVIFAVRNVSPIVIGQVQEGSMLASDVTALGQYTKEYFVLPEFHVAVLKKEGVELYDMSGEPAEPEWMTVSWDVDKSSKGGYPFYMEKEIMEQPQVIAETVQPRICGGMPDFGVDGIPDNLFEDCKRICVVACGTAMHAGLVGKALMQSLVRIHMDVELASEFMYTDVIVDEETLVIAISQSGETIDTLEAVKYAKKNGAKTLAIVNVRGASVARASDYVIYTNAGPEIAVASTKAYTTQLAVLYLLTGRMAYVRGSFGETEAKSFASQLLLAPEAMQQVLDRKEEIHYIARSILNAKDVFMMGRGLDYSILLEGSLKLKEISYIHSEAYASGELKHGTIALITEDTPVVAVVTQSKLQLKEFSNIKEVQSRGAGVILFMKETFELDKEAAWESVFQLPAMEDSFMVMPASAALQLLAYYVSLDKGLDVDKPRNLAKVVTVE
ncbi:MAG: glutamine--fructose-6-phosphate transaminase (isomerizing) [Lachnospiraceae bacterium]|jgi:glucosamine--fructose-6-phosphate aminotransferase (isomerizing)|nr:glutamine--fructose-6-phosphate transaminase (isomerizing) [Lachnospiraceae bacterium]